MALFMQAYCRRLPARAAPVNPTCTVLSNDPGAVLLLRADMDALPVMGQTGLPFASAVRAIDSNGLQKRRF